jgi:hypothetical protein
MIHTAVYVLLVKCINIRRQLVHVAQWTADQMEAACLRRTQDTVV